MPHPTNKCKIRNKSNGRICRAPKCRHINPFNRPMCFIHFINTFETPALIIQNIYRNKKIRAAIRIYKNLPYDIQRKILFHIRENELIRKHHHAFIEKIIIKRYDFLINESPPWINSNPLPLVIYFDKLFTVLDLIIKYYQALSYSFHEILVTELNKIDLGIIGKRRLAYMDNHSYNILLIKLSQYFNLIPKTKYNDLYAEKIFNFINYTSLEHQVLL